MNSQLNHKERYEMEKLVEQKRNMYNLGMAPLGDGILQLTEHLNINVIFLPKDPKTDDNPLSAIYLASKEKGNQNLFFIGVNSAQHYDSQLFSIAHELYHHFEDTDNVHLCQRMECAGSKREHRANQFAASFLLPDKSLKEEIYIKNNYDLNMDNWELPASLRFIAKLHLDYKLPYKAIVHRLVEVGAIKDEIVFQALWSQSARNETSVYYKIAMSFDQDLFMLLNKQTHKVGANARLLDYMLQNFESSGVEIDELAEDLSLFGKTIGEFGLADENDSGMEDLMRELKEEDEG